jgi:uncharacterized protein (TIGR02284 family)
MSVETKLTLNEESLSTVQDLIAVNLDSAAGFREAAEHCTDNDDVKKMFTELAVQRGAQAMELQTLAGMNNETPENSGSVAGAAHRFLLDIRGKLGGGAPVMLIEAERGEDHIKAKYEDALKAIAGSAITDVLNRQYAAVKKGHDDVRDLRDASNA